MLHLICNSSNCFQGFGVGIWLCLLLNLPSGHTQLPLGPENIIISNHLSVIDPAWVSAADLDNDGDMDIISTSRDDNKLAWYKNEDGLGEFSDQILISEEEITSSSPALVGDIDNDGNIDILTVLPYNKIGWYRNEDGLGNFSDGITIVEIGLGLNSFQLEDLDNDGDLDILVSNKSEDIIVWFENEDGLGNFGDQILITNEVDNPRYVSVADMDNDGDLDVLSASYSDSKLAWYEYIDSTGSFGEQRIIGLLNGPDKIVAGDLDNDGDMDVVAYTQPQDNILWYEHTDGMGNFSDGQLIYDLGGLQSISDVQLVDLDKDGDLDILSKESIEGEQGNNIVWHENTNGTGTFDSQVMKHHFRDIRSFQLQDIDKDGDLDMIGASGASIILWYEHLDGLGNFGAYQNITPFINSVVSGVTDINGDNHLDIIYGHSVLAWHDNASGTGEFSEQQVITTEAGTSLLGDIDGDGLTDILLITNEEIVWYKNEGGQGNLGAPNLITTNPWNSLREPQLADLDSDGDLDFLILINFNNSQIRWYENLDGEGDFGFPITINTHIPNESIGDVHIADIDSDGGMDILYSEFNETKLVLYHNENGMGIFEERMTIADEVPFMNEIKSGDLDGDGLIDIVSVEGSDRSIFWYKNLDGTGVFNDPLLIAVNEAASPIFIHLSDIDADNDMDILCASGNQNKVYWVENMDGLGNFSNEIIIADQAKHPTFVYAADIDNDSDLDIIIGTEDDHQLAWYENRLNPLYLSGTFYYDQNENGIKDIDEVNLPNFGVNLNPNGLTKFTDENGYYRFFVGNGDYEINALPSANWNMTTNNYSLTVQDNFFTDLDFGFSPDGQITDVETFVNSSATRCGFPVPFWLDYENSGTAHVTGYVAFELDSLTSIISVTPQPDSTDNNVLFWGFDELPPLASGQIELTLQMPSVEYLGDTLIFPASIYSETEQGNFETLNVNNYESVLNCAYDPNDKLVLPKGVDEERYTLFGEEFEYTIRFQNTGTDTAFTVRLEDQLDSDLDWTTFRPVAASHPYEVFLYDDGLLVFVFENILLPDSTTNEVASHGFVKFRIQPSVGLPEQTEIYNTAFIFFDFNPPIETNTTLNTLVSMLPTNTTTVEQPIYLRAFPNPFKEGVFFEIGDLPLYSSARLHLRDIYGKKINSYPIHSNTILEIQVMDVASGIYFYELEMEGQVVRGGKLIKQK